MSYKVGIGITTTGTRPDHIKWCIESIEKYTDQYTLYVHTDTEKKGVAYSKNMCLYNLKDCDYIFLLDDDVAPIQKGWEHFFIGSKQKHLLYMNKNYKEICRFGEIMYFTDASGVFMFLTSEVINKVGYFNPDYKRYGFEHAGYSKRIYHAGLTTTNFPVLNRSNEFLHALDFDGALNFPHYSTIDGEERTKCLEENNPTYIYETSTRNFYYDFKP